MRRIVNKLAVGRLEGGEPSLLSHLHSLASFGWYFPHLMTCVSIGCEIDPAAIARPARYHIVGRLRCEAARAPSFYARYVNIRVRVGFYASIEGDIAAIGRPAWCACGAVE